MKAWLGTLALGLLLVTPSVAQAECPVLAPIGDKTVTAGQLLTFTATATDADAGQTLTFSLINLVPAGAAIDAVTGVFTWTPAQGPAASDVTIQVADNATTPCLDSEIIHVTVLAAGGENHCPVLASIGDKTVTAGQLLTFTATATDADAGQTLTFSLINLVPAGAAIDAVTGVFTWTPAQGPAASDVTIQVADNAPTPCMDSEIIHVIVSAAGGENHCPVLASIGDKTVTAGQLLTFTATATDADAGQTLTFSLINLVPAGAAIDANTGVFTWTPAQGPAASDVTIQVADNATTPCLDSEIIHVTVLAAVGENHCPVLAPIGDKTVTAGQLLTFTATATDADAGQTLTFSLINLVPAGAAIDAVTGVFTWTPAQGPAASDVTIQVADNAPTPCMDSEIIHVIVSAAGETDSTFEATATIIGKFNPHKKTACFKVEPVDSSFNLEDVVLSSITLSFNGNSISAVSPTQLVTDCGHDGDDDGDCHDCEGGDDDHGGGHDGDQGHGHDGDQGHGHDGDQGHGHDGDQGHGHDGDNDGNHGNGNGNGNGHGKGHGGDNGKGHGRGHNDSAFSVFCQPDSCAPSFIQACFSTADIESLFDGICSVPDSLNGATIQGELTSGGIFVAWIGGKPPMPAPEPIANDGKKGDGDKTAWNGKLAVKVHPNPMNPKTDITFTLGQAGPARISVYDLAGRLVKTIRQGDFPAGANTVSWNGSTGSGNRAASGVYFLCVEAAGAREVNRVTVIK